MKRLDKDPSPADAGPGWTTREQAILLGITGVALLLRLVHLHQIQRNDPYFGLPSVDGRLYQSWAMSVAKGDFAGQGVLILGPFYPYAMGLLYAVTGPSLFALKLVQALLGAFDCVLIAMLARQHFSSAVALLAAGFAAVYGMMIFYGGTVMVVNVLVPLTLASLIATGWALRRPTAGRWLGVGLLVGASALARQTALLFAPVVLGWIFFALRGQVDRRRLIALGGVFTLGVIVCILPFTLANYRASGDWILLNSTGGINFYMGNNAGAVGVWRPPHLPGHRVDSPHAMQAAFTQVAEERSDHPLRPSEVSAYWRGQALHWIGSSPGDWLHLELRKLALFWNVREPWTNRTIEISRDFSFVLRLPLLGFGLVAPLALLGLVVAAPRWRDLFPLYAMLAVYLASALVFFVGSRYRMPIVPVLMVFAALGLTCLADWARARRMGRVVGALCLLAVFAAIVHRDMGRENLYMAHYNLGNKFRKLGRYDEAIASYQRSLAISPGFPYTHTNLAMVYEAVGRQEEAVETWRWVRGWALRHGDATRAARAERHLRALGADPDGAVGGEAGEGRGAPAPAEEDP